MRISSRPISPTRALVQSQFSCEKPKTKNVIHRILKETPEPKRLQKAREIQSKLPAIERLSTEEIGKSIVYSVFLNPQEQQRIKWMLDLVLNEFTLRGRS